MFLIGELHFSLKSITVPKRFRKILLSFSSYSYLNTLAALFVISMDAMMIASMLGLKQTGVYTTMVYITSAIQVPYRSMIRVSSPIIARFWKEKNMVGMQSLYEKSSAVGLLIGLLSFLIVWTPRQELFSFLSAWVCVRWLLKYIATHSFVVFAWYRIAFGGIVLLTAYSGWVKWAA